MAVALAAAAAVLERSGAVDVVPATAAGVRHAPTPGRESAGAPLGRPQALAARSGSWAVEATGRDGEPARWDPCRPVHYVVNPSGMPPGGEEVLAAAVERVERATGLRFVFDGTTDERERGTSYDVRRWGDRWAPALLRWDLSPEGTDGSGPGADVLGRGGPVVARTSSGRAVVVSGTAGLTTSATRGFEDPGVRRRAEAVWLHELGHLVGLAHVEDPGQVVNAAFAGVLDHGAGDLTGLAALGTGPCLDEV